MNRPETPFTLDQSVLRGKVSGLMRPGEAVPFNFPWDQPLPAEPDTAGMALGGFGNSAAVSPDGACPYLNILPGGRVVMPNRSAFGLNTFYYRERDPEDRRLEIRNLAGFLSRFQDFPILGRKGIFPDAAAPGTWRDRLAELLADAELVPRNMGYFGPQLRKLTPRTWELRRQGDHAGFNRSVFLDLFGDFLEEPCDFAGSLLGEMPGTALEPFPGYPAEGMEYSALFPLSRTVYRDPRHRLGLEKTQFCPFLAGREREANLPAIVTRFSLSNPTPSAREFTLLLLVRNISGFGIVKDRPGRQDSSFTLVEVPGGQHSRRFRIRAGVGRISGVVHGRMWPGSAACLDGELGFAVGHDPSSGDLLTMLPSFYREREREVVAEAMATGRIKESQFGSYAWRKCLETGFEFVTGAICLTGRLGPGETKTVTFAHALDFPRIQQGNYRGEKQYARHFPAGTGRAEAILGEAIDKSQDWLLATEAAQSRLAEGCLVTETPRDPSAGRLAKLQTLALNSLSTLLESSSVDGEGRFLMRESLDYPWFNSLDVYFYAMPALLRVFPAYHSSLVDRYAEAFLAEDRRPTRYHRHAGTVRLPVPPGNPICQRHPLGAPVHDMGGPFDLAPNAYYWRNPSAWNDLGPKFVLMVYSDYLASGNLAEARGRMDAVRASLAWVRRSVPAGFHVPFADGVNDTFDNSPAYGISQYQASLWTCSLAAAAALARDAGLPEEARDWAAEWRSARSEVLRYLWDGGESAYLHFTRPILAGDLAPAAAAALRGSPALGGLRLPPETGLLRDALNGFLLDEGSCPCYDAGFAWTGLPEALRARLPSLGEAGPSRSQRRVFKKAWLYLHAPEAFQGHFREAIFQESDMLFVDQGLADACAEREGLPAILDAESRRAVLLRLWTRCASSGVLRAGIPNCDPPDGPAPDARQEGSCWVGLQFSVAAALAVSGLGPEALSLAEKVHDLGYRRANMPFALPESFTLARIPSQERLGSGDGSPGRVLRALGFLTAEGFVDRSLPASFEAFLETAGRDLDALGCSEGEMRSLYKELDESRLKYIASRYTRNLMVHALFTMPFRAAAASGVADGIPTLHPRERHV